VPEQLLNVLKLCLLVLLYLFFLRVVRAVWVEMNGPRPALGALRPADGSAGRARSGTTSRRRRRRERATGPAAVSGTLALVVRAPAELAGRRYELGDELTVGRAAGCRVTLDDTYASQVHARLFRRDGSFFVEDLGSTNGTYLNRQRVTGPLVLDVGDEVQIGSTVLELVEVGGDPAR